MRSFIRLFNAGMVLIFLQYFCFTFDTRATVIWSLWQSYPAYVAKAWTREDLHTDMWESSLHRTLLYDASLHRFQLLLQPQPMLPQVSRTPCSAVSIFLNVDWEIQPRCQMIKELTLRVFPLSKITVLYSYSTVSSYILASFKLSVMRVVGY